MVNMVYMKLKLLFISDLVELFSNKIKEYFWNRQKDRFTKSIYQQLKVYTDAKAINY